MRAPGLAIIRGVAIRRVLIEPGRAALLVLGVALGVSVVVAVRALNHTAVSSIAQVGEVGVGDAALVVEGGATGFPLERVAAIRSATGVLRVTPLVARHAREAEEGEASEPGGRRVLVLGLPLGRDPEAVKAAEAQGLVVSPLHAALAKDPAIASRQLLARKGLAVGGRLELYLARGRRPFTVVGVFSPQGPLAEAAGGEVVVLPLEVAAEAFGSPGACDRVAIEVAPGADPGAVAAALRPTLGPGYEAKPPGGGAAGAQALLGTMQLGLSLASLLALMIGQFLVYNAMSIAVVRRRPEIGVLRAVGATRAQMAALLFSEALVFGVVGAALGVGLGWAIAQGAVGLVNAQVSQMYALLEARSASLDPVTLLLGLVAGPTATVLAAVPPVLSALLVAPVEAARKDLPRGRPAAIVRVLALAGAALLATGGVWFLGSADTGQGFLGGAVLLIFVGGGSALLTPAAVLLVVGLLRPALARVCGVTGALAADALVSHPLRAGVTVAALSIALGGTLAIGGLVTSLQTAITTWVDQVLVADLYAAASSPLGSQSNTLLAKETRAELEAAPGVASAHPIRFTFQQIEPGPGRGLAETVPALLVSLDIDFLGQAAEIPVTDSIPGGFAAGIAAIQSRPGERVAIASNLARARGFRVGDRIAIQTPAGPWTPEVVLVFVDYTSDRGTIYMHRPEFWRRWGDTRANAFDIFCAPGFDPPVVAADLRRRFAAKYDLFVTENRVFRERILTVVGSTFTVTLAMQLVAIGVALLGVVTTLFAAVIERTRELGVLRAVGASRGQLAKAIVLEAALLGLVASLIGAALGAALGRAIVERIVGGAFGWDLVYVFPWTQALVGGLVATALSALAGLLPAARATRLEIVRALSYD